MVTKTTPRLLVKQARFFLDVFHGEEGFEPDNWSRFVIINKKFLKQVAGVRMAARDFHELQNMVGCE